MPLYIPKLFSLFVSFSPAVSLSLSLAQNSTATTSRVTYSLSPFRRFVVNLSHFGGTLTPHITQRCYLLIASSSSSSPVFCVFFSFEHFAHSGWLVGSVRSFGIYFGWLGVCNAHFSIDSVNYLQKLTLHFSFAWEITTEKKILEKC